MIDKKEFGKWFYALQLAKGRETKEDMMVAWYEFLKDLPTDKVELAFKQCVYSTDDFPTVGKLYEMVSKSGAQGILEWCEVLKCATDGREPVGITGEVVKNLGGIDKIGYCENEYQMEQLKRQFLEIYESKCDGLEKLPQLTGKKPKEISASVREKRK